MAVVFSGTGIPLSMQGWMPEKTRKLKIGYHFGFVLKGWRGYDLKHHYIVPLHLSWTYRGVCPVRPGYTQSLFSCMLTMPFDHLATTWSFFPVQYKNTGSTTRRICKC